MYFRYRAVKYFVDIPAAKYKENPKVLRIPSDDPEEASTCLKITSWLGNRPQKCEAVQFQLEDTLEAKKCLYMMPGYEATPPIAWPTLLERLYKEKSVKFTVYYISFSRDLLAHTEVAFKQELISKVLVEERHWGKVVVTNYKIIGVEVPDQLIIHFTVELRKRV